MRPVNQLPAPSADLELRHQATSRNWAWPWLPRSVLHRWCASATLSHVCVPSKLSGTK